MKTNLLLFTIILLSVSGILFSQETNYYLGTGNGSEPQARSCASCHQSGNIGSPKYDTYKNTLHARSEEHTSELQSLRHLVCRLLLEKKNGRLFRCATPAHTKDRVAVPPSVRRP